MQEDKRKSLVVLQTAAGPEYVSMLNITEGLHRQWCKQHGYEYIRFDGVKRGCYPWHASFNRFYMLHEAICEGKYDWALYLDTDCVIVDMDNDFQDLLEEKYALIACRGCSDDDIMMWEINAGVFFLNLRHPAAKDIITLCIYLYQTFTPEQLGAEKPGCFDIKNEGDQEGRANDQRILQGVLYSKYVPYLKAYRGTDHDKFNYLTSSRIKQLLRSYFANMNDRIKLMQHIVMLVFQKKPIILQIQ